MADVIKCRTGTYEQYLGLAAKDPSTLYFCIDTQQLFKGTIEFTRPVITGLGDPSDLPDSIQLLSSTPNDVLYLDLQNHELYLKHNRQWIRCTTNTKIATTGTGNAVTYVSISSDGTITFTKGETFATAAQLAAEAIRADAAYAHSSDNGASADKVGHKLKFQVGSTVVAEYNGSADVPITASTLGLDNALHFVGIVSETSKDLVGEGLPVTPIYINSGQTEVMYMPLPGDVVIHGLHEYIVTAEEVWAEFGDVDDVADILAAIANLNHIDVEETSGGKKKFVTAVSTVNGIATPIKQLIRYQDIDGAPTGSGLVEARDLEYVSKVSLEGHTLSGETTSALVEIELNNDGTLKTNGVPSASAVKQFVDEAVSWETIDE